MNWKPSIGAITYGVQLSDTNDFSRLIINQQNITDTFIAASNLALSKNYFWRVNAASSTATSPWSSAWSFSTGTQIPPPSQPVLVMPKNDTINQPPFLSLLWNSVVNASTYNLQVSTLDNFITTVVNQTGLPTNSFVVSNLVPSTKYYGRVSAVNSGGVSSWSAIWNFTVMSSGLNAINQPTTTIL